MTGIAANHLKSLSKIIKHQPHLFQKFMKINNLLLDLQLPIMHINQLRVSIVELVNINSMEKHLINAPIDKPNKKVIANLELILI